MCPRDVCLVLNNTIVFVCEAPMLAVRIAAAFSVVRRHVYGLGLPAHPCPLQSSAAEVCCKCMLQVHACG